MKLKTNRRHRPSLSPLKGGEGSNRPRKPCVAGGPSWDCPNPAAPHEKRSAWSAHSDARYLRAGGDSPAATAAAETKPARRVAAAIPGAGQDGEGGAADRAPGALRSPLDS